MNIIQNQFQQLIAQFDSQEQSILAALSHDSDAWQFNYPPAAIKASLYLLELALSELIQQGRQQQAVINIHNLANYFTDETFAQHWFNNGYLALTNKRVNCFTDDEYSLGFKWTYQLQPLK